MKGKNIPEKLLTWNIWVKEKKNYFLVSHINETLNTAKAWE